MLASMHLRFHRDIRQNRVEGSGEHPGRHAAELRLVGDVKAHGPLHKEVRGDGALQLVQLRVLDAGLAIEIAAGFGAEFLKGHHCTSVVDGAAIEHHSARI
ncbi:hypothetical protein ACP_0384 [Acidobacterium capsulatum ATCC 51196]|uniref:Uncharacterized protein n=1 Tax=Acidobacterium capsulatum (strain ATCC 51196 / DSM 11244 / BCRC 80197 / JCM 7670 / NBRC 15755 / NCIMB 13165 / 161) TaxID=240015 RepID=C1FA04_ACIC5|nr:hypothetical protein ACP_0384 [Acidobacterium capsulatum ATCC 51196]